MNFQEHLSANSINSSRLKHIKRTVCDIKEVFDTSVKVRSLQLVAQHCVCKLQSFVARITTPASNIGICCQK